MEGKNSNGTETDADLCCQYGLVVPWRRTKLAEPPTLPQIQEVCNTLASRSTLKGVFNFVEVGALSEQPV